jgi:hypothetical protein
MSERLNLILELRAQMLMMAGMFMASIERFWTVLESLLASKAVNMTSPVQQLETVISFLVRVPVLSVQRRVRAPRVCRCTRQCRSCDDQERDSPRHPGDP